MRSSHIFTCRTLAHSSYFCYINKNKYAPASNASHVLQHVLSAYVLGINAHKHTCKALHQPLLHTKCARIHHSMVGGVWQCQLNHCEVTREEKSGMKNFFVQKCCYKSWKYSRLKCHNMLLKYSTKNYQFLLWTQQSNPANCGFFCSSIFFKESKTQICTEISKYISSKPFAYLNLTANVTLMTAVSLTVILTALLPAIS